MLLVMLMDSIRTPFGSSAPSWWMRFRGIRMMLNECRLRSKEDITEIEVKSIEAEGNEGFSSNAMLENSIHLQTEWNVAELRP